MEDRPVSRGTRFRFVLVLTAALAMLVALLGAGGAAAAKKHKRLRLTCDQAQQEIFNSAEQFRRQHNATGWTIEPAPDGLLVGGCKNIAPLTRQGTAYLADVHHGDDGSPPFPGETNPDVYAYHWYWTEAVARTKKGRLRDTISDFHCEREAIGPGPQFDILVLPC